jgi:hypothetical protein
MSQILENKQMIHIVSEVVVLIGLTFYFNQKNKKLLNHIEDLAQRIEEQEDLLQKHENIIKKLVSSINELHANNPSQPLPKNVMGKPVSKASPKASPKAPPKASPKASPKVSPPPQFVQMEIPQMEPQMEIVENPQVAHSLSSQNFVDLENELNRITEDSPSINGDNLEPEEEEDLDSAIAEELQELIEVDSSELSLKKQQ